MNLRTFASAAEFLDAVGPTLVASEAENSLPLGIALRVREGYRYGPEAPFFACVEQGRDVPLVALRTPPYNILLCAEAANPRAIGLLVRHFAAAGAVLPGMQGRTAVATAFAEAWKAETGMTWSVTTEQRLYRLTEVTPPADVRGRARWATETDVDALLPWAESFIDEAIPNDPKHEVRATVERSVAAQALLVWEDGCPGSMCARTRPTPHGASISFVYTPPRLRGRGYASACVAELSQRILDSGKDFCTLYTDLANPTSNAIYQRIGYRPLGDFREIQFAAA